MNKRYSKNFSVLGSAGGVAKAILSILNKSAVDKNDPIHPVIVNTMFHLVDDKQKNLDYYQELFPNLRNNLCTYHFDINNTSMFKEHLQNTQTTLVIDCSWADTVDTLRICNDLNINYINTAFESTLVDEDESFNGFGLIERYKIIEKNKQDFRNITAILGSGMNPGVVQWMTLELIQKSPDIKPLGCYIVEHDNSFFADKSLADHQTIYTTWSPECFLDEAILSYPMFLRHRNPLFLYENVYDFEFKVSLGERSFTGCLMPHEEVITLGNLFDMETGFIYKINDHTSNLIRANLDHIDDLWDWDMEVLDPAQEELEGEDLVGVLLVYENKEKYMYNVLGNKDIFDKYKVNATYFQVACGIYGAISALLLDNLPQGIYYVDELLLKTDTKYGKYLSYYMNNFIIGENNASEGSLLRRKCQHAS
ncbi:MAG: S-adenosylmethionine decarboxylase related protein [Peptococcaceae bacterium]|nr:S-adenosylmethionine decarboxylase related protein [Peptococcaceae bacterium]